MIKYPKKVIDYQVWAIQQGLCKQCVNPTQKGICSCGGCRDKKYIKKIDKAHKWMRKAEEKDFHKRIAERRKANEVG